MISERSYGLQTYFLSCSCLRKRAFCNQLCSVLSLWSVNSLYFITFGESALDEKLENLSDGIKYGVTAKRRETYLTQEPAFNILLDRLLVIWLGTLLLDDDELLGWVHV